MSNLSDLNIDRNKLLELPMWWYKMTALTQLRAEYNHLHGFPVTTVYMCRLVRISVEGNPIAWPVSEMLKQSSLQSLFDYLKFFHRCKKTKSLVLSEAELLEFPIEGLVPELESIDVSNNLLPTLPMRIDQCVHLTSLDLQHNMIGELPSTIASLKHLQILNISSNRLSHMLHAVHLCTSLTELRFEDNCITQLSHDFMRLTNLTRLSMHHNYLSTFPDFIHKFVKLRVLDLHNNHVSLSPLMSGLSIRSASSCG
jgi:Leucine-rich repeat (LRR) protein